jgi:hypothetical protein
MLVSRPLPRDTRTRVHAGHVRAMCDATDRPLSVNVGGASSQEIASDRFHRPSRSHFCTHTSSFVCTSSGGPVCRCAIVPVPGAGGLRCKHVGYCAKPCWAALRTLQHIWVFLGHCGRVNRRSSTRVDWAIQCSVLPHRSIVPSGRNCIRAFRRGGTIVQVVESRHAFKRVAASAAQTRHAYEVTS